MSKKIKQSETRTTITKRIVAIILVMIIIMALLFSVLTEGRENMNMNFGQSSIENKLREELQFPNIYLEYETDWETKIGVDLLSVGSWWDIASFIPYPHANILVSKGALDVLRTIDGMLPTYLGITDIDLTNSAFLTFVKMNGGEYETAFGEIEYTFSYIVDFRYSPDRQKQFSFIKSDSNVDRFYYEPRDWKPQQSIYIYQGVYNSDYIGERIDNSNYKVVWMPMIGQSIEMKVNIVNTPYLGDSVPSASTELITQGVVQRYGGDLGVKFNFSHFISRKNSLNNDEYRIVYNGDFYAKLIDNLDGTCTVSIQTLENKLWVQKYVKSVSDLFYTMSHREFEIGTTYCYIEHINLLVD